MRLSSCFVALVLGIASITAADPLDTLIRERLLTLPPDLPREKVYPEGAVISGDLFKSGKRTAIAVATSGGRLLGLACYVHRDGDWREVLRQPLDGDSRTILASQDGNRRGEPAGAAFRGCDRA